LGGILTGFKKAKSILMDPILPEETNFFERNINEKLANLQLEHLKVLESFYDIAIERKVITKNGDLTGFTDVEFSDIPSRVGLDDGIIEVCYNDLLRDRLIIMPHQQMLYHYVTPIILGTCGLPPIYRTQLNTSFEVTSALPRRL